MNVAGFYIASKVTNEFGPKHAGLDYAWRSGTEIPSCVVGVVAAKGKHYGYGHWVSVDVGNGRYFGWAHMLAASPLKVGDRVLINTIVGKVGQSGSFPTGPHVHLFLGANARPDARPKLNPRGTVSAGLTIKPITPEELDVTELRYYTRKNPTTKKDEWMLTHPLIFPNGVFITGSLALANGFAPYTGTSALLTDDRWDGVIATAKLVYDASWAAEAKRAALQPASGTSTVAVTLAAGEAGKIAAAVDTLQKQAGH